MPETRGILALTWGFLLGSSLSTAIATRYSPMPLITSIVGAPEMEEQQIAQRLARRTGRQCFVSCQLPDHVPELFAYVEKQITTRLAQEGVLVK
ncbi:hypothetical protein BBJ28_00006275 [Nothophytophthora sp. Chile5]|nr:hypothetical protein BBJ28_00006275 [Nothophytophthora sp. Chile5]